jgi:thiamine transport system permease protein
MPIEDRGWQPGLRYLTKNRSQAALWIAPIFFFGVLFYWPLGKILSLGFSGHWISTLVGSKNISILWFTIWQAALSSSFALLFGIPGAYVLYHRRFRGQRLLQALITVPFVLPSIVVAIGFTSFKNLPLLSQFLNGKSAIPIIICANIFMNYSLAVRIVGGVWTTFDDTIEDAAALDGAGRFRTFISVTAPQLKKSIASASALIFLYCAANFGIVLVLGGATTKTIETEIYITATQYLDLPKSSALVLIQTVLTILAFVIAQRFSKGQLGFGFSQSLGPQQQLDKRDAPIVAVTFLFIGGLICMPLLSVLIKAFRVENTFGLSNFIMLSSRGTRDFLSISVAAALQNTLRNALIATVLSITVGVFVSYLISRPKHRKKSRTFQRIMEILFQMPLGISSVILGFGYLVCFSDGIFPLRSSWIVTPIAQSLISIPLVIRLIHPALATLDNELREVAETDSATPSQIWWQIEVPIIRNSLLIATGYALIVSVGDFGAANFLAYGDQGTLPVILFQLISRPGPQNYGMAMAASALIIGFAIMIVYLVNAFDRSNQ